MAEAISVWGSIMFAKSIREMQKTVIHVASGIFALICILHVHEALTVR